jgi:hypothetical protein
MMAKWEKKKQMSRGSALAAAEIEILGREVLGAIGGSIQTAFEKNE